MPIVSAADTAAAALFRASAACGRVSLYRVSAVVDCKSNDFISIIAAARRIGFCMYVSFFKEQQNESDFSSGTSGEISGIGSFIGDNPAHTVTAFLGDSMLDFHPRGFSRTAK